MWFDEDESEGLPAVQQLDGSHSNDEVDQDELDSLREENSALREKLVEFGGRVNSANLSFAAAEEVERFTHGSWEQLRETLRALFEAEIQVARTAMRRVGMPSSEEIHERRFAAQLLCTQAISNLKAVCKKLEDEEVQLMSTVELVHGDPSDERGLSVEVATGGSVSDKIGAVSARLVARQAQLRSGVIKSAGKCVGTESSAVSDIFWRQKTERRSGERTERSTLLSQQFTGSFDRTMSHIHSLRESHKRTFEEVSSGLTASSAMISAKLTESTQSLIASSESVLQELHAEFSEKRSAMLDSARHRFEHALQVDQAAMQESIDAARRVQTAEVLSLKSRLQSSKNRSAPGQIEIPQVSFSCSAPLPRVDPPPTPRCGVHEAPVSTSSVAEFRHRLRAASGTATLSDSVAECARAANELQSCFDHRAASVPIEGILLTQRQWLGEWRSRPTPTESDAELADVAPVAQSLNTSVAAMKALTSALRVQVEHRGEGSTSGAVCNTSAELLACADDAIAAALRCASASEAAAVEQGRLSAEDFLLHRLRTECDTELTRRRQDLSTARTALKREVAALAKHSTSSAVTASTIGSSALDVATDASPRTVYSSEAQSGYAPDASS